MHLLNPVVWKPATRKVMTVSFICKIIITKKKDFSNVKPLRGLQKVTGNICGR